MIDKKNLVAITNRVIIDELPHNVRLSIWELERISDAVVEVITEELAKKLVKEFGRA